MYATRRAHSLYEPPRIFVLVLWKSLRDAGTTWEEIAFFPPQFIDVERAERAREGRFRPASHFASHQACGQLAASRRIRRLTDQLSEERKMSKFRVRILVAAVGSLLATQALADPTVNPAPNTSSRCPQLLVHNGEVGVLPPQAEDPQFIDIDQVLGPVSGQYPNLDTSYDSFYEQLPCPPALGGTLPPEATAPDSPEEQASDAEFEQLTNARLDDLLASAPPPPSLPPLPPRNPLPCAIDGVPVPCDSDRFLMSGQPFEGRDIIYIHGYSVDHMVQKAMGNAAALAEWPQDRGAFTSPGGYFFDYGRAYWQGHIEEHLYNINNFADTTAGYQNASYVPKRNRVLTVGWATTQRLEVAQHAVLTQIVEAMNNGTNVITPPNYPAAFDKGFCANGCVVVSHSTGGLLFSTAMGKLARGEYGSDNRDLPGYFRGHIAMSGAFGGSSLAQALLIASDTNVVTDLCNTIMTWTGNSGCSWDSTEALASVNVDLTPRYTYSEWSDEINDSPVLTLTVSGQHNVGNYHLSGIGSKMVLPGVDDGVVPMHSSCANPIPLDAPFNPPAGMQMTDPVRPFDMGVPLLRAVLMYRDQNRSKSLFEPSWPYFTGMCTPALSPSSMVLPIANSYRNDPNYDARARFNNHFSFVQGSVDHSHLGGGDSNNPWPSTQGSPAQQPRPYVSFAGDSYREESSAITDLNAYQRGSDGVYLVHPTFGNLPIEIERGRAVRFRLFGNRYQFWIWRRIYHPLAGWEQKSASHYAYEYALRR